MSEGYYGEQSLAEVMGGDREPEATRATSLRKWIWAVLGAQIAVSAGFLMAMGYAGAQSGDIRALGALFWIPAAIASVTLLLGVFNATASWSSVTELSLADAILLLHWGITLLCFAHFRVPSFMGDECTPFMIATFKLCTTAKITGIGSSCSCIVLAVKVFLAIKVQMIELPKLRARPRPAKNSNDCEKLIDTDEKENVV